MRHTTTKMSSIRIVDFPQGAMRGSYVGPATVVVFDALPSVTFYVFSACDGWAIREATTGLSSGVPRGLRSMRHCIKSQWAVIEILAGDGGNFEHVAGVFSRAIASCLAKRG